jgi:hypothetical protein
LRPFSDFFRSFFPFPSIVFCLVSTFLVLQFSHHLITVLFSLFLRCLRKMLLQISSSYSWISLFFLRLEVQVQG